MGSSNNPKKGESLVMTSEEKNRSTRSGLMARIKPSGSHIPKNHMLYERLLPASIIVLAVLMTALIIFAAGVLLGLIPFN